MYFPYFRGKQNELIALREMASTLFGKKIIPILEPVKENAAGLQKCILELRKSNVPFVFVINPKYGDFKNNNTYLTNELLAKDLKDYKDFKVGYIINNESELSDILNSLKGLSSIPIALIHYGYPEGAALAAELNAQAIKIDTHIFIEPPCGKLYRRHFKSSSTNTVLIKDGFRKQKNADYPEDELFSELHLTFDDEANGFGDFLTVGDDYSETGGPAYAVAIHTTYLKKDEIMNIKHFISDRNSSPVDPAGKFLEALDKLVETATAADTLILRTKAIDEFIELHKKAHFPGLGFIKKLSMKHHLELFISFLNK